MVRFVARKPVNVSLHDTEGHVLGSADMRRGPWVPPDDDHAEAIRRALPSLAEFGIVEVADGVADPVPAGHRKRGGRHVPGRVTSSSASASNKEEDHDE